MRNIIITLLVIILVGVGAYFFLTKRSSEDVNLQTSGTATSTSGVNGTASSTQDVNKPVIGTSVEGRDITAYHYGNGEKELLFVGGIHGGYEWNTVLVAYELMDYLEANPDAIPENLQVTVIPVLNPDGLNKTVGTAGRFEVADVPTEKDATVSGRFNANTVDLNRNFDCDWKAEGVWQQTPVSGGSAAFSEPESKAIRDYVRDNQPKAVVVWYSSAGGVFASNCHNGVLPETQTLTKLFADASGYPAYQSFNFYEITGDMVNWFANEKIPAISVLLTTHQDTEWDKNQKGIEALLKHYAE